MGVGLTTYDGTKSSHSINLYHELDIDVKDKHILIIEDLVDTAFTLDWVLNKYFTQNKAGYASLNVCCLLDKFEAQKVPNYELSIKPFIKYTGFQVENVHVFVVGYGMDYNQNYRSLPFIGTLKKEIYKNSLQIQQQSLPPMTDDGYKSHNFCKPLYDEIDFNSMQSMDANQSCFGGMNFNEWDALSVYPLNDDCAKTKTNNLRMYQCAHCPRTFQHESNLTIHLKIHSASAHVCRFCAKKFARVSNLRQHERVHTNERPFGCSHCNKSFKQQHSLIDHIRTHTGEKPHRCEFCSKAFAARCNLIVHRRIHTGERPYECQVCNKQYASKSGYNAHRKKYHPK